MRKPRIAAILESMTLTASSHSSGGRLRQDLLVDGRHRLVTDEPETLGGTGAGPSPHELLPASLAACIGVTLAKYADTKEWELGDVDVDVAYDHRSTPREFEIVIHIGRPLDDVQMARLQKVAAACPLRRSLESGFAFREHLEAPRRSLNPLLGREVDDHRQEAQIAS
jgi:putative redox protein